MSSNKEIQNSILNKEEHDTYEIYQLKDQIVDIRKIYKSGVTGIRKIGLTENIKKRIIITRGGISHTNACVGGVDNGSNERLCCPFG